LLLSFGWLTYRLVEPRWGSPNNVPSEPGISCRAIKLEPLRGYVLYLRDPPDAGRLSITTLRVSGLILTLPRSDGVIKLDALT
jgi:hypothetical protein